MQIYNFHLILLRLQVFAEYYVFIKRIKGKKLSFMQWDTLPGKSDAVEIFLA